MPTKTEYKHGTFSWMELMTTDAEAAKKFYGGLFGWTYDDVPAGPGMIYSMAKVGTQTVGALFTMGKDMAGTPPSWLSYVTVDDLDGTAKKTVANGGKVMKEPFDVMDVGRMAVITDPSGAHLALWSPKKHIGASLVGDPGSMCWNELYTTNVDAAGKFYASTLGWTTRAMDMGPMGTYTIFGRPGENEKTGGAGGMMAMPPNMKGVPSNWLVYIAVADCDASAKKVPGLGGKVVMPPTDIPNVGRFAIVTDPQGAALALFKPNMG